ncbi:MAG: gamma-glutamyltransferase family protein [Mycobacteriales bacterium]
MPEGWPDPTRYGRTGAVCTVDHLASAAGLDVLRAGGSAADAAVAANAVLAVTTQQSCGMGGDLVALVHTPHASARALLAVGRAGSGSDAEQLRAEAHLRMPLRGDVRSVTVPGCVDGWLALHEAYGRLPLVRVLSAAVAYAQDGFPVSPLLAAALPGVARVAGGEELIGDTLPVPGEVRRRPSLGRALQEISHNGRSAWYQGDFGRGLIRVGGGLFTAEDLAAPIAEWDTPAALDVDGCRVLSTPAPTQGYLVVGGAWVARQVGALGTQDDPHLLVEAARVTGHDRPALLADGVPSDVLLDGLAQRAARITSGTALEQSVPVRGGGTVYLCAADADGMVVSLSQSNAAGFGAHLAVGEVGVFLHNRGLGFSLEPGHPAELRPGARPPHTLCPALLVEGEQVTAVGTMGGDAQPQVVLQLIAALAAGRTPAQALEQPRWSLVGPRQNGFDAWDPWDDGAVAPTISLEATAPSGWDEALRARGHRVERAAAGRGFGHAHVLVRRPDGTLAAASDPRAGTGDAQAY